MEREKRKFLPHPIAIFLSFTLVSPSIIERVEIRGNRLLKKVSTLSLLTRPGVELTDSLLQLDKEKILRFYAENWFWKTEVQVKKIEKGKKVWVLFEIKEGKRIKYKWSGVGVPSSLPVKIREVVSSERELEDNIKNLLQFYANEGRPFARVSPKNFVAKEDTIFYDLAVWEGEPVWVESLKLKGALTKEKVLKRILKIPLPSLFAESKIMAKIRRLTQDRENQTEFERLELEEIRPNYQLTLFLKEISRQELGLFFTYLPSEKELNGFLSLTLPNLFYTRRRLHLQWQRQGRALSYLLSYTEPFFLFAQKTNLTFSHKSSDTSQAKTSLRGSMELLTLREFLTFSFLTGYERIVEREGGDLLVSQIGQRLTWETREGILPRKGIYLSFSSSFGRRVGKSLRSNKSEWRFEGSFFFDRQWVVPVLSFLAERIFSDTLSEWEKTTLGGVEKLRGFKEEELTSSTVFLFRQDLRFPFGSGFFFPFFDYGAREKEGGYDWHFSFGIGLEALANKSYFQFLYGVPYPRGLLSGRIHFLTRLGF